MAAAMVNYLERIDIEDDFNDRNIALCVFATAIYRGIFQLFATYNHKCLSRKLYVNVKNKYLRLLLGGRCRGRRKTLEEDWYKLNILGLATYIYIALLPVLLAFYAAIWDIYTFDAHSGIVFATYGYAIIFLNILDEILGSIFCR